MLTQYAAFLYCMYFGGLCYFGLASFLYLQNFVVACVLCVLCVFSSASFMYLQRLAVAAHLPLSATIGRDPH